MKHSAFSKDSGRTAQHNPRTKMHSKTEEEDVGTR